MRGPGHESCFSACLVLAFLLIHFKNKIGDNVDEVMVLIRYPRTRAELFSTLCLFSLHDIDRGFSTSFPFLFQSLVDSCGPRRPQGYPPDCLTCEVEIGNEEYDDCSHDSEFIEPYLENLRTWKNVSNLSCFVK